MSVTKKFLSSAFPSLICLYLSRILLPAFCLCLSFWLVTFLSVPHHWPHFFVLLNIFSSKDFHGLTQAWTTLLTQTRGLGTTRHSTYPSDSWVEKEHSSTKMTVSPQETHNSACGLGLSWVLALSHSASFSNPCWLTFFRREELRILSSLFQPSPGDTTRTQNGSYAWTALEMHMVCLLPQSTFTLNIVRLLKFQPYLDCHIILLRLLTT